MATKKKAAKKAASKPQQPDSVDIPELRTEEAAIVLIGLTPLYMHKWSEKAKGLMRDAQQGKAIRKKAPKDPIADYYATIYRDAEGYACMPSTAFKSAAVGACRQVEKLTMTATVGAFHILDPFVRVYGCHEMAEDMVRNQTGVADIRYRARFDEWGCMLFVHRNVDTISRENLTNLFNVAGFASGIGDWRPSAPKNRGGNHGLFRLGTEAELNALIKKHKRFMEQDRAAALKRSQVA